MRPGYALYIHRSAHFSARSAVTTTAEITQLIVGKTSAVIAAIFFAVVIAAQAQESVEDVALPAWTEPTLPSSEPAPQSTEAAPPPSAAEALPSAPSPFWDRHLVGGADLFHNALDKEVEDLQLAARGRGP